MPKHQKADTFPNELEAEAQAIIAEDELARTRAIENEAKAIDEAQAYLEERKAGATRDRLAHMALEAGR